MLPADNSDQGNADESTADKDTADLVLATLNARYIHASFGLRYLFANLAELQARARILEFDISQRPLDIVQSILALEPRILGLGVYIWNARESRDVVALLKRIRPSLTIIVGGPEVSFEVEEQEICRIADFVITGEADLTFPHVCRNILSGSAPKTKVIASAVPELHEVRLPYAHYNDEDLQHRVLYVEASRGCPFTCEFCLSSLEIPVRKFPLEQLLGEFETLLGRGAKHFKFVDRTFNLNPRVSSAIMEFFLARYRPGLFLHFEMVPDRLPAALRSIIQRFPAGALQFEVGIQSFNPDVQRLISRVQDVSAIEDNLKFLRESSGVHVHADLIAGLPGESLESFAAGFDRLVALRPQEIQVGILKRLRGTPIIRHDEEWRMVWSPDPPYEILQNALIDFKSMQEIRLFARYWDLVANSGNFIASTERILSAEESAFGSFMQFSRWLMRRLGSRHAIGLHRLAAAIAEYLSSACSLSESSAARLVLSDFERCGRREVPAEIAKLLGVSLKRPRHKAARDSRPDMPDIPPRQRKHAGSDRFSIE